MQREPLKDLQTGSVSSRQTMKRTPDKAATTAAAKILNSAKKSLTKHCAKKVKLSLQKASGCTAHSKPSGRALAFDPLPDLNDTVEFKKKVPVVCLPKLQLATRKRKKPPQDDEGEKVKIAKQETRKAVPDTTEQCHELIPDQSTTDKKVLKSCSAQRIQAPNLHQNASTSSPEAEFASARLGSDGGVKMEEDESQTDSQSGADLSTTLHTCPACGKLLRHGKFVRHIQICIRQHHDDEDQVPDTMSKEESSDHNSGTVSTVEDEAESLSLDYVFCQLCQKDLSHLNSHRRVLHINKCIDEEEKKKEETEERQRALEAAKTQVLGCPMCGKVLRTASSRTAHLKKCAAALGVGPEQLLAAVKRQEEEHLATLAAGILPSRPGNSARQNPSSTRRAVGGLPKSKLDEDTQLALALSSSLQPDAEGAGTSTAANSRRGRKNKQEEDFLLLKLSTSQAAGRIETRISDLLMTEMENEEEYVPALPQLDPHSLHGQTVHWSVSAAEHCKMFWRLASLEQHCEGTEDNSGDPLKFYVSALMPPVQMSTVAAGSKIRRMSEIPGRRRSLGARSSTEVLPHDEQEDQDEKYEDENLPPFSTQTAALLADMAAENDGTDQSTQLSSHQFESSDIEQQVHEDLVSAFSSLVNHQGYSDVVIQTAESVSLYAHRIILSVRCPALLQQLDAGSGEIDLRDWSPGCVLAMLRFLYAGETKVDQDSLPATLQLAHRFGLASFEQICKHQLDSLVASQVPSCSAAERKQQSEYISSNSSFTNIHNTAMQEADDRKDTAASGIGEDENCREPEPPVLEYCPPISFPCKVQLMHVNSRKKRRIPDRNHDIHFPPGTASRGMEMKEDPREFQSQYRTGTPVTDGVKVMTPGKVLQPTLKHENLLEEVHEVTNDAGEIVSVRPPTDTAGCSVFSEAKKQKTDGVNEVCGMMETDEDAVVFSPYDAGHTAAGSNQAQAGGFCEGVGEFVSHQRKKEGGYQPKSDDAEIRENEKSNTSKMHKSNPPFSRQSGMQSSQDVEPVESIEISDEDLFSSDDEVSLFPMSPAQSTKQNVKEDGTEAKCDRYGNASDADKESCHVLSDSECVQKITQNEPSHKASGEDNSCERTKTENTSLLTAKSTGCLTAKNINLLTSNPLFEQQRHQQPSIDDSLSCESISAIEYSYQRSSLTSPKHRNFQTSTPELGSEDGQTRRRTDGKMKLRGERDVPGARSKESSIESKDLVNLSDYGDKTVENETTWKPENKQTPCASVIEQDSLYVTPLVEGRAMRRTFQLVTPSPQQTGAGCPAKTPVSHCEAKKSDLVPSASRSDRDIDDEEKRKLHKETVSRDSQPKQNCLPEQSPSDSQISQPELKKTEDSFVGGDSDSDLEIIDTSIQNMPSPKFGLSCSQTQSQVASQSLKLSLPENRSKPSPDKAVSLSRTRSPIGTKSVGQHLEHHREYDRSPRPLHSPSRISPSDLLSRFSQRSSESDKELLRVTELICSEAEEDHCMTSGKGDADSLCDSDINDVNRSKEDIWDGFDNLDDYNPDLYLGDLEKNTADISINKQEQSSPQPNPKSVSEYLPKTASVQFATSPFKTPTKSPRKSKEMSARKAAAKVDTPKGTSSQNQIMYRKINYEGVSPVKAQSSASGVSMSSRTACDNLEVSTSCGEKNAQSEYAPSRGFLITEGDGFLFADEDTEAANSSFLWSEENAPTEDCASCDQEDFKWTGLQLGREGTVCTQEAERLLVQTPVQTKQTSKGGKSTRVPPSPFTPMPHYDAMTTPELKIEVQKFGLKPVGKKRMKMVLKDIYQKTHQYETDSDYEDSSHLPNLGPPVLHKETDLDGERRKAPTLHRESNRPRSRPQTVQADPPPSLQKQSKKEQSHAARHSRKPPTLAPQTVQRQETAGGPPVLCREADRSKPVKKPKTKRGLAQKVAEPGEPPSTKRIQHQSRETEPKSRLECPDLSHLQSPAKTGPAEGGHSKTAHSESPTKSTASYGSSPEKGTSSSQDSDASEQPDVSIFEEGRLDSDDSEDITPSQQLAAKDLPQKLMGFIQSHPDWYHKVLKYEPLDLGVLKENMKAAGIKCSQEKLLDFLDEKCITFTTKNMIPRKQRSRGKRPQSRKHAASQK